MNNKHYATSKIFIGLFVLCLLLTYVALALTTKYEQSLSVNAVKPTTTFQKPKTDVAPAPPPEKLLDTKGWQTYKDKTYPISFQYPKGWTAKSTPINKQGFYTITVKPSDKTPNIQIFISQQSFLGMEGLKVDPYTLGTLQGQSVDGSLIALKAGDNYFTFDGSLNTKDVLQFKTLMSTVQLQ